MKDIRGFYSAPFLFSLKLHQNKNFLSVGWGPATLASPTSLLEMQNLKPHPDLLY